MALLEGKKPRVAVIALDIFKSLIELPKGNIGDPDILDKHLCSALLKNPAVTTPLVQFAFPNATPTPASDLEYVATLIACPVMKALVAAEGGDAETQIATGALTTIPPGRYVNCRNILCFFWKFKRLSEKNLYATVFNCALSCGLDHALRSGG